MSVQETVVAPPTGSGGTTVGGIITSIANTVGVDPVLALAVAWQESGLNPQAKGDYGVISGSTFTPETPGTPGGYYTSFGLYQLHKGGELGNLTEQEAFNVVTNATTALTHIAAVAAGNPGASPGDIAAMAQGPENPGQYAVDIDALYSEISQGDFPTGFEAAYNVGTTATGTVNTAISSSSSSSTATTESDASGNHGVLHTMQSILNQGPIDTQWYTYFYGQGEIEGAFNIALVIVARAAVILVGASLMIGGAIPILMDLGKLYIGSNRLLQPLERLQRLTIAPQRVEQAQQRLELAQARQAERSTPMMQPRTPAESTPRQQSLARLRLEYEREARRHRERGEPFAQTFADFLSGRTVY